MKQEVRLAFRMHFRSCVHFLIILCFLLHVRHRIGSLGHTSSIANRSMSITKCEGKCSYILGKITCYLGLFVRVVQIVCEQFLLSLDLPQPKWVSN